MIDYMSSKPLTVILTGMKMGMLSFGISNVVSWAGNVNTRCSGMELITLAIRPSNVT